MSLKIEFVERVQRGEKIAPLCREYGISRTTGHKWWSRYEQRGYDGLDAAVQPQGTTCGLIFSA